MVAGVRRWPGRETIRRWHFYAGLLCLPFVVWLAVTGSIYLFRPQIEAIIDRPYAHLATSGPRAAAAEHAAAAVRVVPGSTLHRYQLPAADDAAVQVVVGRGAAETRVYIDPRSLAVLKTVAEDDRLMRIVFRLHGELLIGDTGSYIVELAASWTIVMIVSGLCLWWPHGGGVAGVVYPRLWSGRRALWRDLHAVTGFWISFFALFLLLSGLPWAKSWGSYLKAIRAVAEGSAVSPDWSSGSRAMAGDHVEHGGMTMAHPPAGDAPLDRLVATVTRLNLAAPVLIAPPTRAGGPWSAKSDAADRPQRTSLTLDGASGRVVTRTDFAQRRLVDRIVGYGIAAHEGQLFGVANQLLNLATAIGLVVLTTSGIILWWRRRPTGTLGAPPAVPNRAAVATGFVVLLIALGVLLPLFGASLLAVVLVERVLLSKLPRTRRWLGLGIAG